MFCPALSRGSGPPGTVHARGPGAGFTESSQYRGHLWFQETHNSHSIGAMYSEATAANYLWNLVAPKSFDALLFVEKTTAARKNPPLPVKGYDFATHEYHDPEYVVSLKLTAGWDVKAATRWGDQETTVTLADPQPGSFAALYFKIHRDPQVLATEEQQRALRANMTAQRLKEGMRIYRVRRESIQPRTIGGRQALSCIVDSKPREEGWPNI